MALAFVSAATGCHRSSDATSPQQKEQAESAVSPAPDAASESNMEGLEFRLYEDTPTAGGSRRPTFWIQADRGSLQDDGVWALETVQAIIYSDTGEDVKLAAGRGRYDTRQQTGGAFLEDGVTLQTGATLITLNDLVWNNDLRQASSEHPVTIEDGASRLDAASMVFAPATSRLVLRNVTGEYQLPERNSE